ncbi:universal stress protein [Gilvimarinus sp. SDUM040013]|uniref:Universal stress protein n=1 Tax=Gilvimarinus gilvus TaxID=3058038 RepID=A0ABU4RVX5_9GAMM|nr:universal stress protein [Gilvimarinus sp. SDUM040013]MDO3388273.1 universal stress protein [Gilvimarinus sp. SDUM040013]MDX6847823.1 universal stress protein [Gilvimarinus sp. SDUM040013]
MAANVIACIDDSQYAESVCDGAAWAAQQLAAPLHLLHVLDYVHGTGERNLSGTLGFGAQEALLEELASLDEKRAKVAMEQGKLLLAAAQDRVAPAGLEDVQTRQRHGEFTDALVELENETRLLVVGKRGAESASAHGHIGSHIEKIIRAIHKPILIVQPEFTSPKALMIAYDGSATIRKGIEMIAASPLLQGCHCHLVMVGADLEANRESMLWAEKLLQGAQLSVESHIISGDPENALVEYQSKNNIELLVLGAYGHSRIRHFIVGSTTTAMICRCRTSMLVLR